MFESLDSNIPALGGGGSGCEIVTLWKNEIGLNVSLNYSVSDKMTQGEWNDLLLEL